MPSAVSPLPSSLPRIVLAAAVETCWEMMALAKTLNRRRRSGRKVKGPTASISRAMMGTGQHSASASNATGQHSCWAS
ncbi:MAG: hypothetical protein ACOY3P_02270, partial [Planctomycetota bacterium]